MVIKIRAVLMRLKLAIAPTHIMMGTRGWIVTASAPPIRHHKSLLRWGN
jgi:hypothetical protein